MNTVRAGVIAGVTVAAGAAAVFGPLVLSVPGGLLLAVVLPGLAITEAVFPPGRRRVELVERLVLIPALSLAALVLGGLGLWAIGGTLNQAGWSALAVATTLVAVAAAVARARLLPEPETEPLPLPRPNLRAAIPLTLAVVLLAGAGWWSFSDSERVYDITVATLSAAPPGPVDEDGNRQVRVSATGLAPGDGPYRLVMTGTEGEELSRQALIPDTGGDWTGRLRLPGEERVTVSLFRGQESSVFRTVVISAAQ
ncbi:hypothetical protein AB0M02_37990 [Actinoplanes sp. NPDC051861]|uniref:hypothetical protein n=1 Tax=Actinoplanes sp. NPDC051861 TaxID=3155170 RepID=UPI00342F1763